ncbi:MAG: hypothetical protein NC299_09670 [Lachnospiraceae bacterium]|nr:hypothetical protein [Ruminococcus sp.]MCM1275621.1 hypothetical protein [Lachnospiraceae bacterium]
MGQRIAGCDAGAPFAVPALQQYSPKGLVVSHGFDSQLPQKQSLVAFKNCQFLTETNPPVSRRRGSRRIGNTVHALSGEGYRSKTSLAISEVASETVSDLFPLNSNAACTVLERANGKTRFCAENIE